MQAHFSQGAAAVKMAAGAGPALAAEAFLHKPAVAAGRPQAVGVTPPEQMRSYHELTMRQEVGLAYCDTEHAHDAELGAVFEVETRDPGLLAVGTVFAGEYLIERLLGRGGMGAVYLASKIDHPEEQVALKLSLEREEEDTTIQDPAADTEVAGTEVAEAANAGAQDTEAEDTEAAMKPDLRQEEIVYRLLAGTDSSLFPKFYGAGLTDERQYYVVMEYVAGYSLRACLEGEKKLPLYRAIEIALQLCGLQVLHEKGFVYRDLKPQNVQIRRGSKEAVLLDFGLAQETNKPQPQDTFTGTPAYVSPEQALGKPQDQRADIYALGLLLYEMITGENPMLRETNQATVIGQVSEPMPNLPFSEFESRLDTTGQDARGNQIREMFLSLKHLIQSMTAKDKERRVASLQRVKEVLQGVYPIAKELASTENLEKKAT